MKKAEKVKSNFKVVMCYMSFQNKVPDISVIVPVYNSERYLRKCLDSILSQSFKSFEVIAIDDGSSDGSLEIIKEYEAKHGNFRFFSIKKSGVSEARNLGIREAKGEYLSFVDSDDFVEKNFLQVLYENAIKYDADIVCCNYYLYWPRRKFGIKKIAHMPSGIYESSKIIHSLIKDFRMHFFLWNKLWKKAVFVENSINFPCGKCYEDVYACLAAFYFSDKVFVVADALYSYVRRKGSFESSVDLKKYRDYVDSFKYIKEFLNLHGNYGKYRMSHVLLGIRMIFSSIPMLFCVFKSKSCEESIFNEFKSAVKSIFYCIFNKAET